MHILMSNGKPNRRWGARNKFFFVTPFELFNTLVSMFPSLLETLATTGSQIG